MPDTRPTRILHVDDREDNRYVVARILRQAGFEVMQAATGKQALEMAMENPDLIIMDVKLPDMLGYEVCRRIKANPTTAAIPVIQLSASFVSNESRVQALDSGADQYLTQPVEPPVLVASIKALLRLRRAEALSLLSAQQWQSTFDALSEGIGLLNQKGQLIRCNRALPRLLGLAYHEIEGLDCQQILQRAFAHEMECLSPQAKRQSFEISHAQRWFRITLDPVVGESRELRSSILVVHEISDQKRAEEALKVTDRLAATGRLAHSIAHEINNPLEAVTNLLYLLRLEVKPGTKAEEYINIAERELSRVGHITKQTLSFHRDTRQPVEVHIADLIENVLFLYRTILEEKNIEVERNFTSSAQVYAFPGQLRQVFANLIANAIDALPRGGRLKVRISDSRSWKDGREGVRVLISDNGGGIEAANMNRIFDAFFTTKEQKGSGLGLWLSRNMVIQNGGEMRVRSSRTAAQRGTTFSVFLPVVSENEAPGAQGGIRAAM